MDNTKRPKFLQDDFEDLKAAAKKIDQDIKELEKGVGESTSQSSESWHDNTLHEELIRKVRVLDSQYQELRDLIRNAKVIEPNTDLNEVGIGNIVHVEDTASGASRKYIIGSYMILNPFSGRISYAKPVARLLLGAKKGQKVSEQIGGKQFEVKINEIDAFD